MAFERVGLNAGTFIAPDFLSSISFCSCLPLIDRSTNTGSPFAGLIPV